MDKLSARTCVGGVLGARALHFRLMVSDQLVKTCRSVKPDIASCGPLLPAAQTETRTHNTSHINLIASEDVLRASRKELRCQMPGFNVFIELYSSLAARQDLLVRRMCSSPWAMSAWTSGPLLKTCILHAFDLARPRPISPSWLKWWGKCAREQTWRCG